VDPARVARVDLSQVDRAKAHEALASMTGAIEKEIARYRWVRFRGIDLDDLRVVAQLAVLEAVVTYSGARGRKWSSWAYQLIRWRLSEAVTAEMTHDALLATQPEDCGSEPVAEDPTPEDHVLEAEGAQRVRRKIAYLTPRAGVALSCKLHGESLVQIGATVGIHYSLVSREIQAAVQTLSHEIRAEDDEDNL
jgi:RNA polymerase sigma factor (sigma-70 family)